MANISENLVEALKAEKYSIHFYDEYLNTVEPEEATEAYIFDEYFQPKTIKLPKKKLVTPEYIFNKLNSDKVYQNFSEKFEQLLKKEGLPIFGSVYPTSYGFGIFVFMNYRNSADKLKDQISNLLEKHEIDYTNEYSDAGWVFRYKISKSSDNIKRVSKLI